MKSSENNPALLPAGFFDLLPGEATAEARGLRSIMDVLAAYGYERVRPPLLEFEESLLSAGGAALSEQAFRIMDPTSHRMMALRPDMTTQIARMSQVRLGERARPLRLSYSGECVVIGSQGRDSARQMLQAGLELIGPDSPAADAEVVAVSVAALERVGIDLSEVSFDISMPTLVWRILEVCPPERRPALAEALERRDSAAIAKHGGADSALLVGLAEASGPANHALAALTKLDVPSGLRADVERLVASARAIMARVPGLSLTIDPIECRGWRYHTGLCMAVYSRRSHEELGLGGRYMAGQEPACGLTLRPQALLRAARPQEKAPRCLVPDTLDDGALHTLHGQGYVTIAPHAPWPATQEGVKALAARHRCKNAWMEGKAVQAV
ncbi:ATP phosphoribosyltransferase regulatory subunit [Formicincola oecophyllae]|uniref:ATP phosphoribosyltransferase regulatory subunit n=1 Tax=Formicincola oecophyllae TaxID=2558361 RepID=A0A4Y6U861_9PROT|nr:ATP phosphoribosyltransferase regulatory subunit [Formicincola oecophyllae]QDH13623.1 ATP phosphoribosyltransferase regulatory subunit [Formicincola oecophyllae]